MSGFAEDFFEARARFLAASAKAGLEVETIWHPTHFAPDGRRIAVDVARVGRRDASHVLFTVCGTHGVEGYPGSAAQIQLIESGLLASLPSHVAVVLLHGLNPYAWSRDSQRNEDGMDINRNFIDFAQAPQADLELVSLTKDLLNIKDMSFGALSAAIGRLADVRQKVGGARFMQALMAGQYVEPLSIKFGGSSPSWSNLTYRDIVRRHVAGAEKVAELDWHTGLGSYGGIFPLCFVDKQSDGFEKTCEWWGRDGVVRGTKSWSDDDDDAVTPDYSGLAHSALVVEANGAEFAGGVIEFGTLPVTQIPMAVFLDHWLTFNAPAGLDTRYWRAQMRTFMAPRDRAWEHSVLDHAARINARTLEGLAAWR